MQIKVTISDEITADYIFTTDLALFVAENEDGLDGATTKMIAADIECYGEWRCGGGASPVVTVVKA